MHDKHALKKEFSNRKVILLQSIAEGKNTEKADQCYSAKQTKTYRIQLKT